MIRVNRDLESQLSGIDVAQLCDESGKPMGHFMSEELFRRLVHEWANSQTSDEELERRRNSPGSNTLAEILQRLQAT